MVPVFTFFAVDKGNMTLIEFPNGVRMLVDCRESAIRSSPLQYLREKTDRLDVVVISHPHRDHLTGLAEVCEHYRPKSMWHCGRYFRPDPVFDDWNYYEKLRKGECHYCKPRQVRAGQSAIIGDSRIWILGPVNPFLEGTEEDVNNNGIVLSIVSGSSHVVVTGDTQAQHWATVDVSRLRGVSVFLASHHGRQSGFCDSVMRSMKPKHIVISDGKPADTDATAKYKTFAPVSTTRERNIIVRPSLATSAP